MTSNAALAFVCLVACGHSGEEVAIATPARMPERIAPGVPHGGVITHVAITEQGDAALSLDNLGELRLWPSLDGKRPPVPIAAAGVSEVGLGSTGGDLLAALLDQAGAVRLLRLGRDGTVRGHAQLPGDVASVQLVMIDDGVLVVPRGQIDRALRRYLEQATPADRAGGRRTDRHDRGARGECGRADREAETRAPRRTR